eukprot:1139848-Pelagomonas_calceolata.AAC.2
MAQSSGFPAHFKNINMLFCVILNAWAGLLQGGCHMYGKCIFPYMVTTGTCVYFYSRGDMTKQATKRNGDRKSRIEIL